MNRICDKSWLFRGMLLAALLSCILLPAFAGSFDESVGALKAAETINGQLEAINLIADEHADALLSEGWYSLNVPARGLPENLVPENWEEYGYTVAEGFPRELREHKCIVLFQEGETRLYGAVMSRLPSEMRAASMEDAEYALVFQCVLTESGYVYTPSATSYHRDYSAYALNLKTGEAVRFWFHRNGAASIGPKDALNGRTMSDQEIWLELRDQFLGQLHYSLENGAALIFMFGKTSCYLQGYEGEPVTVEVPEEVAGYPVTELGKGCFMGCRSLKSVVIHENIKTIPEDAFSHCKELEEITLPDSLEVIDNDAFYYCSALRSITFPEGLKRIGHVAFFKANALTEITLPASLAAVGREAFSSCDRLNRVEMLNPGYSYESRLFLECRRLACLYTGGALPGGDALQDLPADTVIYAPEGSQALLWAQEKGYQAETCENPENMPHLETVVENGLEFLLLGGEAYLSYDVGDEPHVAVPAEVAGAPVTVLLSHAFPGLGHVESITLPASVREVRKGAIGAPSRSQPLDVYISNPETVFGERAIVRYASFKMPVTIHAPEGSTAQAYAADPDAQPLVFEPWDGTAEGR